MSNISIFDLHNDISISTKDSSWQVSEKKGMLSGISASVTGLGAIAKLQGTADFTIQVVEESNNYHLIQEAYNIEPGANALYSWIKTNANDPVHKEEIIEMFKELSKTQELSGTINIDLSASGQYPNVEVTATAYISVLNVTNSSGSDFNLISSGSPSEDTGAFNPQNGQSLPSSNNNSTIIL